MSQKRGKPSTLTQLGLAARASRTALSAGLADLGLYSGQDAVLMALAQADGLSLRELAERLSVRPPTITKTIARLSAQSLVEKRASPSDARQNFAHLTPAGRRLVDEVRRAQQAVEAAAFADFSGKDRRRLRRLLRKVERNLAASGEMPVPEG